MLFFLFMFFFAIFIGLWILLNPGEHSSSAEGKAYAVLVLSPILAYLAWKYYLEEKDTPESSGESSDNTDFSNLYDGYSDNWKEVSRSIREKFNWTCTECGINMNDKRNGLHVHHIDRDKQNNNESNLQVLCALCHRHVGGRDHADMKIPDDVFYFIQRNSVEYRDLYKMKNFK